MKALIAKESRVIDRKAQAQRLALAKVDFMTDAELLALPAGSVMIFDTETYPNYFYAAFKSLENNKIIAFERSPAKDFSADKMAWVLWRFCLVGFNSKNYDLPMLEYAMKGATNAELKAASDSIIEEQLTVWAFQKKYKVKAQNYNHIDLIEVAPLVGSLKLYAGRLHAKTIQDLPFNPSEHLTQKEALIVGNYCAIDLDATEILFNELAPQLKLRSEMSQEYGVDLRSKSDAQIAEAVINSEIQKITGYYPRRPKIDLGSALLFFDVPFFIEFKNDSLKRILETIANAEFELDGNGSPIMPKELSKLNVTIGKTTYKLGIGGLHSQEKSITHTIDSETILADNDVASFYPRIILNQGLYPEHLGQAFLDVYNRIVETRMKAKKDSASAKKKGDIKTAKSLKVIADSLKITINGSFGKLGNKYSTLYAPQLMLQVTLTGQLVLLMLIEMLDEAGINVVSGNTDGIVSKYHTSRHADVRAIIKQWEEATCFDTEETQYKATYSRDVNTYIAISKGEGNAKSRFLDERLNVKTKGFYSERGSALNSVLSKNPETLVCMDAVLMYLKHGKKIEDTIKKCSDIRRFVTVRNVKGGGEKDGIYLGKVVRWYYAKGETSCISYVKSGNKVPKSDGAKPLMDLPQELPNDINFDWYIKAANDMLYDCGALRLPETDFLF